MTIRQRRWRACTVKVVADLAMVPGCMAEGRGGCGDVRDEKAHRGYRRKGSSCHHCRHRKAARNGVKKMSGTQSRGSERQTAPDYQAITVGCTGSESNLRVKAWVKQS
jgi:hypothetical protein